MNIFYKDLYDIKNNKTFKSTNLPFFMRVGFFYDYDMTLTEECQQFPIFRKFFPELKKKYGIKNINEYRNLCNGGDIGAGWMGQFLKDSKEIFNNLTNEQMKQEFAPKTKLAPGLSTWFERVGNVASSLGIELEHHVISVGISALIEGSAISPYLTSIVSGKFRDDGKGIYKIESIIEPFRKVESLKTICKGGDLHKDFSLEDYYINYRKAIIFGDGLSDKDWFRYTKQRGGYAIALFGKGDIDSFNKCVSYLGAENPFNSSVNFILPRDYRTDSNLEKKTFQILKDISESEKKCDMDWELVNNWKLNHIRNQDVINAIKKHFDSCKYCQNKINTEYIFE